MATQLQVIQLHAQNPKLTAVQIADRLDCSSGYVRATARRCGLKLPVSRPDSLIALGTAARDAGLTVEAIQRLAQADSARRAPLVGGHE